MMGVDLAVLNRLARSCQVQTFVDKGRGSRMMDDLSEKRPRRSI